MLDTGLDLVVCATCGTQFASPAPPERCPICADERQYVGHGGQHWTTLGALRRERRNMLRPVEPGLTGIGTEPSFAIGQRALLVEAPGGNVLWDCVTLLDEATAAAVEATGGVHTIAISHPHYYSAMGEWGERFDARILLHAADREHVMRPSARIEFWEGERLEAGDGLELVRLGGHFAGGTVLHWAAGGGGRGALLSGDIVQVIPDRRHVGFMYSYPNLIPLPVQAVRRIGAALEPLPFETIYGAWWGAVVRADGKGAVRRSVDRYARAVEDRL